MKGSSGARTFADIIVDPFQAFERIEGRSHWPWPVGMLCMAVVAAWSIYYARVDIPWLQDVLLADTGVSDPREMEAARLLMGRTLLGAVTIATSLLLALATMLLGACYLALVARLHASRRPFTRWLAFAAWLAVPDVAVLVLMAIRLLAGGAAQLLPDQANPLSLAQILGLGTGSPWLSLGGVLGVQTLWKTGLCAVGLRRWVGIAWPRALVFAAAPALLFYGGWALWILQSGGKA